MARQLRVLTVLALIASAPLTAPAADGDKPERQDGERKSGKRDRAEMSSEFEDVRKALDALTPEQRKRFQENFIRWSNLPIEQKKALRDRDELRRKKMAEEIEAALRESGLELDRERRHQFVKRYAAERRKIEEQLRAEMDEKRKPLVKEMVARLKQEFSRPTAATPAPAPSATP